MTQNIHNILSIHNLINGAVALLIGLAVFMTFGLGMGAALFTLAWACVDTAIGIWGNGLPKGTQFFSTSLATSALLGSLSMAIVTFTHLWKMHLPVWIEDNKKLTTDLFLMPKWPSRTAIMSVLKQAPKSLIVSFPVAVLSVFISLKTADIQWKEINLAFAVCLSSTFLIALFVPRLQALRWALLVAPGLLMAAIGYFALGTDFVQNSFIHMLLLNALFHNQEFQDSFNKRVYGSNQDKDTMNILSHVHMILDPNSSDAYKARLIKPSNFVTLPGADRPLIVSFDASPKKDWTDVLNNHSAQFHSLTVSKGEDMLRKITTTTNHEELKLKARIAQLTGVK